ncbi:MAG: DUF4338 domain-containing protein [Planctomycetia bacterium]|nr:DUF4338 domain-containing protein [Planctomycetia bacterium]
MYRPIHHILLPFSLRHLRFCGVIIFGGCPSSHPPLYNVGRTKGRGRQDVFRKMGESIKDIYVYPLEEHFRMKM